LPWWWWHYESKHVATFITDNTLDVFSLNLLLNMYILCIDIRVLLFIEHNGEYHVGTPTGYIQRTLDNRHFSPELQMK